MSRVTTIDIANRLGISRGTVSKALNGRNKIDERTRLMVQKAADEMGYKKIWGDADVELAASGKTLSIMVQEQLFGDHYWSVFVKNFGEEASRKNLKFTVDVINAEEEANLLFPRSFSIDPPGGIATIGPISEDYYRLLQASKLPVVYVDTVRSISDADIFGDTLFVCNKEYTNKMTTHLINKGHKKLGFVSAYFNCRSFNERWLGFLDALEEGDLQVSKKWIFGMNPGEMIEDIRLWIASLKELPTAFICANDFFAMALKASLNEAGLDVPKDIALCGFDNDKRLSALYPDLTTADSSAEYMGKRAMQQLSWRLENPDAPYEVIKITSNVYYRNSTEGYIF